MSRCLRGSGQLTAASSAYLSGMSRIKGKAFTGVHAPLVAARVVMLNGPFGAQYGDHAPPGYQFGVTVGPTFRFLGK